MAGGGERFEVRDARLEGRGERLEVGDVSPYHTPHAHLGPARHTHVAHASFTPFHLCIPMRG